MLRRSHPPKILLVPLLQFLDENKTRTLFVSNSGDMYIDRAAVKMGLDVHASDSTVLGRCMATLTSGEKFELRCNDDELDSIFAHWPGHRFKSLIQIQFALKIGEYATRKNDFQKAKYQTCLGEALPFFHKSIQVLEKNKYLDFRVTSFRYCHFSEHLAQVPQESHCLLNLLNQSVTKTMAFRFVERIFADDVLFSKQKIEPDYVNLFQYRSILSSVFSARRSNYSS